MSNRGHAEASGEGAPTEEESNEHLRDVEDGCGCAEIWEHLSERRAKND
jgi:hypothetical protein